MRDYHHRWLEPRLRASLEDTPVVLLNGARQTGKSTLAQAIADAANGVYLTLDEPTLLSAASADPVSFIERTDRLIVIDEVQKAPELFPAIKRNVDRNRKPGRFLLTGSADVFMLPKLSESLAGRMEVLTLHPLAQGEIESKQSTLIPRLFADDFPAVTVSRASAHLETRVVTGGFPEALARSRPERRLAWFNAYVTTITQRDVRELSNIGDLTVLPRLLSLLAVRSGGLLNVAELARASGVAQATLHRYLALLEATFLFQPLPAWHANLGKRLIKAPKAYLLDSGLACALSGVDTATLIGASHYGGLLETFVLGEFRRQCAALPLPPRLFHYRSAGGVEVDFVIENAAGQCVGIEVKATKALGEKHYSGLRDLQSSIGRKFSCGVIVYGGTETATFGPRLHAVPLSALWSGGAARL